ISLRVGYNDKRYIMKLPKSYDPSVVSSFLKFSLHFSADFCYIVELAIKLDTPPGCALLSVPARDVVTCPCDMHKGLPHDRQSASVGVLEKVLLGDPQGLAIAPLFAYALS